LAPVRDGQRERQSVTVIRTQRPATLGEKLLRCGKRAGKIPGRAMRFHQTPQRGERGRMTFTQTLA
jgi:hypothetical protein